MAVVFEGEFSFFQKLLSLSKASFLTCKLGGYLLVGGGQGSLANIQGWLSVMLDCGSVEDHFQPVILKNHWDASFMVFTANTCQSCDVPSVYLCNENLGTLVWDLLYKLCRWTDVMEELTFWIPFNDKQSGLQFLRIGSEHPVHPLEVYFKEDILFFFDFRLSFQC